jgi:hypothetical protein
MWVPQRNIWDISASRSAIKREWYVRSTVWHAIHLLFDIGDNAIEIRAVQSLKCLMCCLLYVWVVKQKVKPNPEVVKRFQIFKDACTLIRKTDGSASLLSLNRFSQHSQQEWTIVKVKKEQVRTVGRNIFLNLFFISSHPLIILVLSVLFSFLK